MRLLQGYGFLHACLAVMDYNLNNVVNALLEGSPLPYPVNRLDRTLPSPSLGKRGDTEDEGGEKDFIALQKEYLRSREREAVSSARGPKICPTGPLIVFVCGQEEDVWTMQQYSDEYDDQCKHYDFWILYLAPFIDTAGIT